MMGSFMELTVEQYLFGPCSKSLLYEIANEDQYWRNVEKFYKWNRDRKIMQLTEKQRNWLPKIKDGLIDVAEERD